MKTEKQSLAEFMSVIERIRNSLDGLDSAAVQLLSRCDGFLEKVESAQRTSSDWDPSVQAMASGMLSAQTSAELIDLIRRLRMAVQAFSDARKE